MRASISKVPTEMYPITRHHFVELLRLIGYEQRDIDQLTIPMTCYIGAEDRAVILGRPVNYSEKEPNTCESYLFLA